MELAVIVNWITFICLFTDLITSLGKNIMFPRDCDFDNDPSFQSHSASSSTQLSLLSSSGSCHRHQSLSITHAIRHQLLLYLLTCLLIFNILLHDATGGELCIIFQVSSLQFRLAIYSREGSETMLRQSKVLCPFINTLRQQRKRRGGWNILHLPKG